MSVIYAQHKRRMRCQMLAAAISLALGSVGLAHAQSVTKTGDAAAATTAGSQQTVKKPVTNKKSGPRHAQNMQEIVVTAMKTAKPVSKTPIAMSVIGGDKLKTRGITDISQIGDVAPGVIMARSGFGVNINIRGVTTTDQTSKGEPGIGFYIDDMPIRRPQVRGLSFFDIDHITVLRGPQGTLYGGATTGGVINVVANKPEHHFAVSASGEIGNYGTHRENAMINIPMGEVFALRVAANANDRDGYLVLNHGGAPHNDQHDRSVRAQGLFTWSPETSLLLGFSGSHISGVGYSTVPLENVLDHGSGKIQRTGYSNPFGGDIGDYFRSVHATFKTAFGGVAMTYVGGVNNFSARERSSMTSDPAENLDPFGHPQYGWGNYRGHFMVHSNELRFSNRAPGKVEWVAGINRVTEDIHESDHDLNAPVFNPTVAGSVNGIDPVNRTTHKSLGAFGQATYHFSTRWAGTLGLRYSKDKNQRVGTFAAGPQPGCTNALEDCIGGPNNGFQEASKVTYRVGLQYFPSPGRMFYGSVATGYKPGGFNDFDPRTMGTAPYDPEQLIAYEFGFKGRLTDSLHLNSDVFYYDYAKEQISSLVIAGGSPVIYTRSVPTTIYGWENQLDWQATSNDHFSLSASFERSHYDRFEAGILQNIDWSGYTMDKTPHAVVKLRYSHEWIFGNGAYLDLSLTSRYSSGYYVSDIVGAIQYKQDPFTRSGASLTFTSPSDRYWVQAYIKNIEDEVQITSVGSNADAGISAPRFFGVRFGVRML